MNRCETLLRMIARHHKKAFDNNDYNSMADAEEEALIICDRYNYPVNNPNLLLASYWPEDSPQ